MKTADNPPYKPNKFTMAFEQHKRTAKGTIRQERKDSLMKNLKKEYPVLERLNGNIKTLGGAEKSLGVTSLDQVLKKAGKMKPK